MAAWMAARSSDRGFLVRMEDLDTVTSSVEHEQRQLHELATIGLDWDGAVERQSERFDRYHSAIDQLRNLGFVYPCFCTRREIRAEIEAAPNAPHGLRPDGAYPGTCRDLTESERTDRAATGRPAALRLRTEHEAITFVDDIAGEVTGSVDDVVLARADGVPAYNLAVVVDDAAQGVTQVVRGDDLLSSTPRQIHLQRLLGYEQPRYAHVALVMSDDGERLAKRHGAVTLDELAAREIGPDTVVSALARSLGLLADHESCSAAELRELVVRFELDSVPREPMALGHLERLLTRTG